MSRKLAVVFPIGALLVAMWAVRLPYYAEGPGPAKDVEPLIHVRSQQTFPSAGHFILEGIGIRPLPGSQRGRVSVWWRALSLSPLWVLRCEPRKRGGFPGGRGSRRAARPDDCGR